MKLKYRNPIADSLDERWRVFEEQANLLTSYLQRFGFKMDTVQRSRLAAPSSWKFSAIFRNSRRIINLSLITTSRQEGAVSLFIYPVSKKGKTSYISLYKYLRKHFSMVNRKYLFLNQYSGDFSQRLQKVIESYARFSQFYMQSILQGLKWDDWDEED